MTNELTLFCLVERVQALHDELGEMRLWRLDEASGYQSAAELYLALWKYLQTNPAPKRRCDGCNAEYLSVHRTDIYCLPCRDSATPGGRERTHGDDSVDYGELP